MARGSFWADVETQKYMTALRIIDRDALPQAVALTLNRTADAVTNAARGNIERRLIVRTRFTTNSLTNQRARPFSALNKAMGASVDRMFSRAGSFSPYLLIQDAGGTISAGGRRLPIPTVAARTGQNLRRSIRKAYRMDQIGNVDSSGRFFIGRPKGGGRPLGIYERHGNNKRLRMIRNLSQSSVTVPASRWFSDAVARFGTPQFIRAQFLRAARERLERMGGE